MSAELDHMNYCRALLSVPDDETLAVAIEALKARAEKAERACATLRDVLGYLKCFTQEAFDDIEKELKQL